MRKDVWNAANPELECPHTPDSELPQASCKTDPRRIE